ncbi:hypothetical protein TREPR_0947 [Treponema primitia ZAS-2]|uniref:Uncharacterized protein n=1 Tax=Treponema primitia (strain ATCC BAA-887 / DSM 12427 / ZAS-2) TaxID=545694 RepID=F5YI52_TREPZ|nr:hypothetical protein TREPR_0947 [Treponema primitia ZAS-2]
MGEYRDSFPHALCTNNGLPAKCYLRILGRWPDKPSWKERIKWLPGKGITVVCC